MNMLAEPFVRLIWRTPLLKRDAGICIALALISAAAEVAVALALLPVLASLGFDAGAKLSEIEGAVLHFKFTSRFVASSQRQEGEDKSSYDPISKGWREENRAYSKLAQSEQDLVLHYPGSKKYESSQQLVDLGIMRTTAGYESFKGKLSKL